MSRRKLVDYGAALFVVAAIVIPLEMPAKADDSDACMKKCFAGYGCKSEGCKDRWRFTCIAWCTPKQ
jgi:hypothetical protein